MMMSDIYYGNISPVEAAVPSDPEYRALAQKISKLLKELETILSPEQMAQVNELHNYINELYCFDCEEKFKYGLAMGLKFMQEVNEYPLMIEE